MTSDLIVQFFVAKLKIKNGFRMLIDLRNE